MSNLELAFGRRTGLPEGLEAAWGARLIWPADLVHNRQDMVGSETQRRELSEWLNGVALSSARDRLRTLASEDTVWNQGSEMEVTLFEDERGKIIGSPQASHGYVYVAAWLK
jgi:hypothetical protein